MSEQKIKALEDRIKSLEDKASVNDTIYERLGKLIIGQSDINAVFIKALIVYAESHSTVSHAQTNLILELETKTSDILKRIIRAIPAEHRGEVEKLIGSLSLSQHHIEQAQAAFDAERQNFRERLKSLMGDQPPPSAGK